MQNPVIVEVLEIPRREVQRGPVVPEGNASGFPFEPHRVLRSGDLLEQQVEHVPALARREVDDLASEGRVHVDHPFLGLRMNAHHRVDGRQRVRAHEITDLLGATIRGNGRAETVSARRSSMKDRTGSERP